MAGSDKVRFCSHCSFEVNNLSALTRKQALRLVRESKGRICVRYVKNPVDNAPVFADRLYKITRRASLAAGVLGATLAVSTLAYAQGKPVLKSAASEIEQTEIFGKYKSESPATSISGTVFDPLGAVVPNTKIKLTDTEGKTERETVSNEDGVYRFENVEEGKYRLAFVFGENNGFKPAAKEVEAIGGKENTADVTLELTEMTVTVGDLAVVEYRSPLFAAVFEGAPQRVENLIVNGAAVNERDENYGRITPLFIAVENGSAEVAEKLLNFGAQINMRDDFRQTPLMRLDEDASVELVDLLLKHGARVNLTDKAGNNALMLAARSVKTEVLQVLLRRSANVDARNAGGRTALMEAADADHLENVRALLLAGADANSKDNAGETAFDLTSDAEIKQLLTEFGAEMKAESN
jgi:hypothetical protein